jgi:hypothetical protein
LYQQNKDAGLMVINAITENNSAQPPSQEDLQLWAETYGLTIPVIADAGSTTMWSFVPAGSTTVGLPFAVLIDRGVVVESANRPTFDDAIQLLGTSE